MADPTDIKIRVGQHTSALSFASVGGSLYHEPMSVVLPNANYNYLERDWQRASNEPLSAIQGAKTPEIGMDLEFAVFGQGGSGSGDGVISSTAAQDSEVDQIWEACFGEVDYCTGETTHASAPGTGTSLIMDADFGSDNNVETAFLFETATEGWNVARAAVARSAATYTLDRAPVQRDGSADTPGTARVCYAARTFALRNDLPNRAGLFVDVEGFSDWRRAFYGCAGNLALNFPDGGLASYTLSGLRCYDWDDTATGLTYSAPTRGSNIVCKDSPFYIGSTYYMAHNISLDLGLTWTPRANVGAPNGNSGYVLTGARPKITATLLFGDATGPTEVTDTVIGTLQGNTEQDIAFQIGQDPGAAMYVHAPQCDVRAALGNEDGLQVVNIECMPVEGTTYANLDNILYVHLF